MTKLTKQKAPQAPAPAPAVPQVAAAPARPKVGDLVTFATRDRTGRRRNGHGIVIGYQVEDGETATLVSPLVDPLVLGAGDELTKV